MVNYTNINNLIPDLITNPNSILTPEEMVEALSASTVFEDKSNFWQSFLYYLHNNDNLNTSIHDIIKQFTLKNTNSIFEFINDNADLPNEAFDELFDIIKQNMTVDNDIGQIEQNGNHNYFWNESINSIIAYFINAFKVERNSNGEYVYLLEENLLIHDGDRTWEVNNELTDADAAYTYTFSTNDCVLPWTNNNNDSFYEVIDINAIQTVIEKSIKNQHTRTQPPAGKDVSKWIRLIMPQNNRRVEALDLNRNFWVIGQTLDAISAYLFRQDNPISTLVKDLINEQLQLWENIAFLWFAIANYYNADTSGVKFWNIPLPSTEYQPNKKYDFKGLNTSLTWGNRENVKTELQQRYHSYIDKYYHKNFVIVPEIMLDQTYPYYYERVCYPLMLIHKANKNNYQVVYLTIDNQSFLTLKAGGNGTGFDISGNLLCYRIKDEKTNTYWCTGPKSKIREIADTEPHEFRYSASSHVGADVSIVDNEIQIKNVRCFVNDVGSRIFNYYLGGTSSLIYWIENNSIISTANLPEVIYFTPVSKRDSVNESTFVEKTLKSGCYYNEILSNTIMSVKGEYTIDLHSIPLLPIMGTANSADAYGANYEIDRQETSTLTRRINYKSNDKNIVEKYAEEHENSTPTKLNLAMYVGSHTYSLWTGGPSRQGGSSFVIEIWPSIDRYYYKLDSNGNTERVLDMARADNDQRPAGVTCPSQRMYYPHHRMTLYNTATIVIPTSYGSNVNNVIKTYEDYWWYTDIPREILNTVDGVFRGWSKNFSFFYKKKNQDLNSTNWAIRYIQCSGGVNPKTGEALATGEIIGGKYQSICTKVKTHIFLPNNYTYFQQTRKIGNGPMSVVMPYNIWIDKYYNDQEEQNPLIYVNANEQQLQSIQQELKNNYDTIRNKLDSEYELIKASTTLDYEAYPNNGKTNNVKTNPFTVIY